MDAIDVLVTIILPLVVSFASVYIAIKILPFDIQNKRSDTIEKLYRTVDKLVEDLDAAKKVIEEQNVKIKILENRQDLTLRTQLHITLSDPPVIKESSVEYVLIEPVDVKGK